MVFFRLLIGGDEGLLSYDLKGVSSKDILVTSMLEVLRLKVAATGVLLKMATAGY